MKIISKSLLWSSAFSLVLPQTAFASLSSAYASLVDTSQNQAFESEPQAAANSKRPVSSSFKLAAVHFITKNGQLSFGSGNPGEQEFNPGDLCKSRGYLHKGCSAGYIPGEACTEDSSFVKECIDPDTWCRENGYNVTSCTLPKYLSGKCPHSSTLYKSCETDNARACRDAGYASSCEVGKIGDRACPYDSKYKTCICNPCTGFAYTSAQASAQGYVPGEVCNSCGTIKYKRTENACSGFKTCDCGGATGAKTCWSGTVKKFDTCKECCDTSKYKYDSSNCTGGNQLAGNSCGGKYDTCKAPLQYLYSDKTVSSEVIPGKSIIGIAVDPENRLAVAIDYIKDKEWGGYGIDIPTLENIQRDGSDSYVKEWRNNYGVRDGKANTAKILAYGRANGISYPVAEAANNYQPSACSASSWCGKGNWYLPSTWQVFPYFDNRETILSMLEAIGKLPNDVYYTDKYSFATRTSNEIDEKEAGILAANINAVLYGWKYATSNLLLSLIYITY